MTTRHFCTYFDHNYLPRALLMLDSLHEHCPEAHIHVLCLSAECHAAMEQLHYPYVSLLNLPCLEKADPEFAATRPTRSLIEYYFTLTPCLPWYLLVNCGLDEITYLDADMMFFASPDPLFEEASDASIIITPHRFSPRLEELRKWGIYNVSWLTFRNTASGMACLEWYRKACLEWCYDVLEDTRFADQKYLDRFPEKFSKVHVMHHHGGGIAPWNVEDANITESRNVLYANGVRLIFYHAQGFKYIIGPFYATGFQGYGTKLNNSAVRFMLKLYAQKYAETEKAALHMAPDAHFSGIRENSLFSSKDKLVWLRKLKRVCLEARHNSLLWL